MFLNDGEDFAGLGWGNSTANEHLTFVMRSTAGGDFDGDSDVDAADYVVWRKNDGTQEGTTGGVPISAEQRTALQLKAIQFLNRQRSFWYFLQRWA